MTLGYEVIQSYARSGPIDLGTMEILYFITVLDRASSSISNTLDHKIT